MVLGAMDVTNSFCPGHPEDGQPVLHPGFEYQRFPGVARRYLGGLAGAAFPGRFGGFSGFQAGIKNIYLSLLPKASHVTSMAPSPITSLTWTQGQILDFSFLGALESISRANFR